MEVTKRRRARRSAAQWAAVVSAYRRSGQTQEAFAGPRGGGVAALSNRLSRRSGDEGALGGAARGFVPVGLREEGGPARAERAMLAQALVVVRWPQRASGELHGGPAAPGVAELVRSLLGPCSH